MRLVGYVCLLLTLVGEIAHGDEIRASFAMDSDPPRVSPPKIRVYQGNYRPLWTQALARPENDMQRVTAETIARAHLFGYPGMTEFRPRLLEIMTAEQTHPVTRFAAARALLALDTREAAPTLFKVSQQYSADLRQLIEPTLGDWKYQPLAEVWRARLNSPETRHRDLVLAIDGAVRLGDVEAVPLLLKMVHDPLRITAVRLEAAESSGQLRDSGLEPDVAKLLAGRDVPQINRLCAVRLLAKHSSETAREALLKLAVDTEPSVAAAALGKLFSLNPDFVVPLAEGAMQNADPIVRLRGSEAYAARPNPARAVFLVRLLDDPHPQVRGSVREAIYVLTKTPELDAVLRPAIMAMLAADGWRGQEQAALLLGELDHEPATKRLIQLLEAKRGEVMTTAAWALRKLAVPDTLPAILDKAQRQTTERKKVKSTDNDLDAQVVHLFECMGLMKYKPAEPLLREHVPKSFDYGQYSRGAAIWALGYLHEDKADEELVKQFVERMLDRSIPAEMSIVHVMCTISLGRMRAKSQEGLIRGMMPTPTAPDEMNIIRRWVLNRITGETFPDLIPDKYSRGGFFLTPLDEDK